MIVWLESVRFRIPEHPENGAFALSVPDVEGGRALVSGPEWQMGQSVSPVAFALGTPFIEVDLRSSEPGPASAVISASASPGALLGDVEPTAVPFANGRWTGRLNLPRGRLGAVAHEFVQWKWQVTGAQVVPEFTEHEVYTVPDRPTDPWDPTGLKALAAPWKEALDIACSWARGARSPKEVLSGITVALYNLGLQSPPRFVYGCKSFADAKSFQLAKFLQALEGDGTSVDCADCATVVSTFANLLGCSSWQVVLNTPNGIPFVTNPVRAIGCRDGAEFPFNQHETVWDVADELQGTVWDACLGIDGLRFESGYRRVALSPATAAGVFLYSQIRRAISP